MAAEATVEVEDPTIVTVELPDDEAGGGEGTPVKPGENGTVTTAAAVADTTAADEAATALKKAVEDSKKRENVALATADAERRRAEAAEGRATAKDREAQAARDAAANSQLTIFANRVDAATRDLDAAKAAFKVAHEAGDVDKMADAQANIGRAAAQVDRFTADKDNFEAAAATRAEQAEVAATTAPAVDRSVEGYIARGNYAPAAAKFLRDHPDCVPPEFGGTAQKNDAMMAGHYAAKAKNLAPNSQEYFDVIETYLNGGPVSGAADTKPAGDEGAATATRQTKTKTPVPSATPSRDPPLPDGTPTGKQTIKLNTDQQEMALLSFPQKPNEEEMAWKKRAFGTYANEFAKAKKEGIIGRQTH